MSFDSLRQMALVQKYIMDYLFVLNLQKLLILMSYVKALHAVNPSGTKTDSNCSKSIHAETCILIDDTIREHVYSRGTRF